LVELKGKESLVSMCGRLRKVSIPPALTLVELKGKESLVSMCGKLRKVSTPSNSRQGERISRSPFAT
jgi:hypothetical protein